MQSDELVRLGRLAEALGSLESEVRSDPTKPDLRVAMFQLLCVLGDWPRALAQLNVAAELDGQYAVLACMYRPAITCEALRSDVFAGKRLPMIFGKPQEWQAWLVEANRLAAQESYEAAAVLRDRAFDAAQAVEGEIDGQAFEWIADADMRLGPVLEAIVEGKYYWIPISSIADVAIEPPNALCDLVWTTAHFTWANGGQSPGLIPARYPGSHAAADNDLKLGRKTEWLDRPGGYSLGLGQRLLATDKDNYALLATRHVAFKQAGAAIEGEDGYAG